MLAAALAALLLLPALAPADALATSLVEAAECLAQPNCTSFSVVDVQRSLLAAGPGPYVAHFVGGQARTFSRQHVYEAFVKHAVDALPGRADVFLCLGNEQGEGRGAEAWLAALAAARAVGVAVTAASGQSAKLRECYHLAAQVERSAGRNYTHVMRSRPDLLWTAAVPAAVLDATTVLHKLDMVGLCPRRYVSRAFPCDVTEEEGMAIPGDPAWPLPVPVDAPFQVTFERRVAHINTFERRFAWPLNLLEGLKAYARQPGTSPAAARGAALNVLASLCAAYDWHMHEHLFYEVPTGDNFQPVSGGGGCDGDAAEASPFQAMFQAAEARDGARIADAVPAMQAAVQSPTSMSDWIRSQATDMRAEERERPTGRLPHLEAGCACRWRVFRFTSTPDTLL